METENKERLEGLTEAELLSTLTGTFFPDGSELDEMEFSEMELNEGIPLDGAELLPYEESIRKWVDKENQKKGGDNAPCNLMDYFSGSDEVNQKAVSAVTAIKNIGDVLYGCTRLKLREPLNENELSELREYIEGQYGNGWGEEFEQRDIPVEGGTLNVHFWQGEGFRILREEETGIEESPREEYRRPKLSLLGHDGNIFSILADARRLLAQNGERQKADEMSARVWESSDYKQALGIISGYVETELSPQHTETRQKKRKKYEITAAAHPKYPWMHRICALTPVNDQVGVGALGGYVQSEDNLSQEGSCWIYNQAVCCEDARVQGDARLYDGALARGSALITGDARMFERACADGNCCIRSGEVKDTAQVSGEAVITDDGNGLSPLIAGNSRVYGNVSGWYVIKDTVLPGEDYQNPTPDLFILEDGKRDVLVKERKFRNPEQPGAAEKRKKDFER